MSEQTVNYNTPEQPATDDYLMMAKMAAWKDQFQRSQAYAAIAQAEALQRKLHLDGQGVGI